MSKTTFTPGPWYVESFKHNGNLRIMAEECTPVAVVSEHMPATARLIAAAPDLYEAVEMFERYLKLELDSIKTKDNHICNPDGGCDSDCQVRYYLSLDYSRVMSILAKVRGDK